jgi:hypothetical protein
MGKKIEKKVGSATKVDTCIRAIQKQIDKNLRASSKKVDAQGATNWGHDGAFQGDG